MLIERSQTHMFKYLSTGHASFPPVAELLTLSKLKDKSIKLVSVVCVLVMPDVGWPKGSVVAKQSSIFVAVTIESKTFLVFVVSGFCLL